MKKVLIVATSWYLALWSLFAPSKPAPFVSTVREVCEMDEYVWTKARLKEYAKMIMRTEYPYWNSSEYKALAKLWGKESAWNPTADNPTSTAFGVAQILNTHPDTPAPRQVERGLAYIQHRYEKPSIAWAHWRSNGWY